MFWQPPTVLSNNLKIYFTFDLHIFQVKITINKQFCYFSSGFDNVLGVRYLQPGKSEELNILSHNMQYNHSYNLSLPHY